MISENEQMKAELAELRESVRLKQLRIQRLEQQGIQNSNTDKQKRELETQLEELRKDSLSAKEVNRMLAQKLLAAEKRTR